ncbi:nitroreductase family protein [Enorma burkinafasonensis]|uniref:nitroreductase family protein n=1 Tax=Enorma burkinafasonensis TaxID=2590867 RepID=UPI0026EE37CF|nr:nitroreductase family protein [Enorma burkinafasonensis]MCI7731213.1 nitroreductase family protein [Enorma burkinafasonensis]
MSFADLTRSRFSCRSYESRAVTAEALDAVIEAGRIAPSAHNNHPTRVIVCDTPELRAKAARAAHYFDRGGSVFGAPVVLIACAVTGDAWVRTTDGMNSSLIDTSIVVDQMMMQATELGLGTCWVCMFDPAIVRAEFDLPAGVEPVSMLTLGYPAEEIAAPEKRAERCIPRERFLDPRA